MSPGEHSSWPAQGEAAPRSCVLSQQCRSPEPASEVMTSAQDHSAWAVRQEWPPHGDMPVPGLSNVESKSVFLLVKHKDLQDELPAALLIFTGKNMFFVFLSDSVTDRIFVFPQNAYTDHPHTHPCPLAPHDSEEAAPQGGTRKARLKGHLLHCVRTQVARATWRALTRTTQTSHFQFHNCNKQVSVVSKSLIWCSVIVATADKDRPVGVARV